METRNETSRFGQTVCLDSKFQVNRSRFNLVPGKRRVDSSSLVDTRIQWKLRDKSKASSSMQYIRLYRRRLLPVPHNAIPSNQGSILFETFLWKRRGCHPPIDVSKRLNAIASPHLHKVWGKRTVGWEWPHPPRSERWFNSFWQRCLTPPNWISAPPVISSLN